ncbi:lamin tail domain-containing protein, partial [Corynebacterium afermentans]|uniref:lamin tail domain-containing protein n=1 Tax=Corynebacterium afermentans TaxID=38286 RepID=UPI00257240DA
MKEVFRRVIVPVSTTVLLASAVVVPAQAKISAETVADAPIVINEIDSNKDDWVELFNRTDKKISLKGWKIQDVKNDTDTHKLDGTIKPYGYFVLDQDVNLDKDGEEVLLIDPDGKVVDRFKWTKTKEGPDFYRCPDGIGKLEKAADGYNTQGKSNGKCGKSFFEAKAKTGPEVELNGQLDAKDYVDARDGLGKISQDTKYEFVKPVDTSTSGEKKATVEVTYPGNHKETVDVTITVTAEADKRTPQPKDRTVDLNAGVKPEDSIGNVNDLPGDTKFGWKGAEPNTSTPGDKTATVVVTYPDSSTDEVEVKISVKEAKPSTSPESPAPSEPTTTDEAPEPTTTAAKPKPSFPHGIRINEVNSQGAPADWVELYNETGQPVDISGWTVVDDKDGRKPITFPKDTRIQPGAYFVFYTEGKTPDGSKGFGLGKGDAVRVFDANGDLVDEVTWEAETHADPYGRDESDGGDLDFKVLLGTTRGEKNLDPFVAPTTPWQFDEPGNPQAISDLNVSEIVGADFSGIDFDDEGIAWVVNNGTGKLWAIRFDDNGNAQVGGEWQLRYSDRTGTPDAEGVTVGKDGALYVATERDGGDDKVSRPSVLRFERPKFTTGELEATHEWNLSGFTGEIGANSGLEAISYLGEDLYAVGVESDGKVYFVDLANDTPVLKDSYKAPFPGVMALDYDMTSGELRVLCDEKCGGASIVLKDNNGKFEPQGEMQRNPENMGTSIANEGYGTFTKVGECVDGKKQSTTRFLWTDDGATGGTVLRTATSVNEEDCAVPTTSTEQAKPSEETPTSEPVAPAEPTSEEPTSEEDEPTSEEPTSEEDEPTSEEPTSEEDEPTSEEPTSEQAEPTSEEQTSTPISTTVETQPSEPAVTTSEETPGEETTEPDEETGEAKPSEEETSEEETPAEDESPAEETGEDKPSEEETPAEEPTSEEDEPSSEEPTSEEDEPTSEEPTSEQAEPTSEEQTSIPISTTVETQPSEPAVTTSEETPGEETTEPDEETGEAKPSE